MAFDIAIRAAGEADLGLILNSWLKSYRNSDSMRTVTNDIYYSEIVGQKARILELMAKGKTLVACDPTDPEIVYAWANIGRLNPPVVNYVYTKQVYRRQGIAKCILSSVGIEDGVPVWATHESRALRELGKPYTYVPHWRPAC